MSDLDVLGDDLALGAGDDGLGVGAGLQPEGYQPADEDDPRLQEALLGTVEWLAAGVRLPAHHAVVGLGPHGGHVYSTTPEDYNQTQSDRLFAEITTLQGMLLSTGAGPLFSQDEKIHVYIL